MLFKPTRHNETGKWETPTKARIKGLIEKGFLSIWAAEWCFGVSYSTIWRWLASDHDQQSHSLWTEWPWKLNKQDWWHLIWIATTSYEDQQLKWKELGQLTELKMSEKTIKQACAKKSYHKCKACRKSFLSVKNHQIQRHFARVYSRVKPDFWKKIMWSDECSFDMSRGITKWMICTKEKHYHSACCESVFKLNLIFILIWGTIEYNWKSSLMFLKEHKKKESIMMKNYKTQILETVVGPAFAEQLEWNINELFQKNNASVHGAEHAKNL